jgi:hypothetical protein
MTTPASMNVCSNPSLAMRRVDASEPGAMNIRTFGAMRLPCSTRAAA